MATINRRTFVRRGTILGGSLAAMGPLQALGAQVAAGQSPNHSAGYGPLVPKGDLALPPEFNYQIISHQGRPMSDGNPTPGIFDGMGAYRGRGHTTILIRNHENRRRAGEIPVIVPPEKRYDPDPTYDAGDTKLVVRRRRQGRNPDGTKRYVYTVESDFAILGGTDTNCAGGIVGDSWVTCEEVVNRGSTGLKHGYNFEVPAYANGPVKAVAIPAMGRFVHEAVAELDGIIYETEDVRISPDVLTQKRLLGACLYRYTPDDWRKNDYDDDDDDRDDDDDNRPGHSHRRDDDDRRGQSKRGGRKRMLAETDGRLQALKLRDEFHANMDVGRVVGKPYPVEWVDIDDPDHEDDTDNRRDRVRGFTPTRVQGQDKGAAFFDRQEGIWTDYKRRRIYFDCTEGGTAGGRGEGQVWEYDPHRRTITLVFESPSAAVLDNPDNVVIVPKTGDIFLQEDSEGEQFVRGVTPEGEIYNFAQTITNDTEFCGGCFDPNGDTLYLNQQGERLGENEPPQGAPESRAVTYAIYGPFDKRRPNGHDDDRRNGRHGEN